MGLIHEKIQGPKISCYCPFPKYLSKFRKDRNDTELTSPSFERPEQNEPVCVQDLAIPKQMEESKISTPQDRTKSDVSIIIFSTNPEKRLGFFLDYRGFAITSMLLCSLSVCLSVCLSLSSYQRFPHFP
jgi:hypothetical protein